MENLYLFIVVILFILAISDLIVGVSNDAVNFLNSAIGAKVASFRLIMGVAALGVFIGATFSSGMMEVARKGIFNPQYFYFAEIMIIFLAVMFTDVILLDGFNTLGMPTSTTVSIVFELLGAAVAISFVKINSDPNALPLYEYINTSKALGIISGILISVVISFTVGAIVQFVTRIVFSFNYQNKSSIMASVFGGVAISLITYFILIKGAKGATFMSGSTQDWIKLHTGQIILFSFIGWTILMQTMYWIFKFNAFKFIILVGTFALAMAFAGNDLVNFIGVPLAGLAAFKSFIHTAGADPGTLLMESLSGKVQTESYLLLIAGLIMVVVLYTSKKAKGVVKTSLDLSRQDEGEERFGSSMMGRAVVRMATNANKSVNKVLPSTLLTWMDKRFDDTEYKKLISKEKNPPSFDLIRASVNLVVASVLIALATSYKLPLSTTYVTFMVAMGTSLADKAWGRESAVYRVTGVVSVIGGWFLTALIAFTSAFVIALIIYWTGTFGIIGFVLIAVYVMYRTQLIHKERTKEVIEKPTPSINQSMEVLIKAEATAEVCETVQKIADVYVKGIEGLNAEDRKQLKKALKNITSITQHIRQLKRSAIERIKTSEVDTKECGLYYIHVYDNLMDVSKVMISIIDPAFAHVDNNHKTFTPEQKDEILAVSNGFKQLAAHVSRAVSEKDFEKYSLIQKELDVYLEEIKKLNKIQFRRLKNEKSGTKISMLYLEILNKTKIIAQGLLSLLKAQATLIKEN